MGYKIKYSQNFIRSEKVAEKLINFISANLSLPIIELAAGTGMLSKPLLHKSDKLILIEKDKIIFSKLKNNFSKYFLENNFLQYSRTNKHIEFINQDIFDFEFPENSDFRIVGNIPFAFTSDIIRLLLDLENPPTETYLLMQLEAAKRLVGIEKENFFSLVYKPKYQIDILYVVDKTDFTPAPSVDGAWVSIKKRDKFLVENYEIYLDFLAFCFLNTSKDFTSCLKKLFSKNQIKLIAKNLDPDVVISQIGFPKWLEIFQIYLKYNYPNTGKQIKGSYQKLLNQQTKLQKRHKT